MTIKNSFLTLSLAIASHLAALPSPIHAAASDEDPLISKFPDLVSWFQSNGGTIDPRITVGYEPDTQLRGVIATDFIPSETILLHCPSSLMLKAPHGGQCADIAKVVSELEKGEESSWHVYLDYDDSLNARIPSQWDAQGRAVKELQGLPPSDETHRHVNWFWHDCLGGGKAAGDGKRRRIGSSGDANAMDISEVQMRALLITLTRAADIGLIPIYDLLNHHNGLINTRLHVDEDRALTIYALTDIHPGSPVYNTYARSGSESSTDVFNTYGFVEPTPQLWRWNDESLIKLKEDNADHAFHRYGIHTDLNEDSYEEARRTHVPNSEFYEILVISDGSGGDNADDTEGLGALSPTTKMVRILGNGQRSHEDWYARIHAHHANLRSTHVQAMKESASSLLYSLPTTIEEDEILLEKEEQMYDELLKVGRNDFNKLDIIKAIRYRLAFKRALRLVVVMANKAKFLTDDL